MNTFELQAYGNVALNFFKKFGKVKSVNKRFRRCHQDHTCQRSVIVDVLIQFKNAKVANALIELGRIRVHNVELEVKPKNEPITNSFGIERMQISLVELMNASRALAPKNAHVSITDVLDDDCLGLIFEKLDLIDVVPISTVCKRFKRIAEYTFPSKIRSECIVLDELVSRSDLPSLKHFLRVFGSSVLSVSFNRLHLYKIPDVVNILLKAIAKYCQNLRFFELNVGCARISDETMIDIHPFLVKLKSLRISFWRRGSIKRIISACTQLASLVIIDRSGTIDQNVTVLPAINFPNLIKLSIDSDESVDTFLDLNPQMEEIQGTYSVIKNRLIANKMLNFRKLKLVAEKENLTEIGRFNFGHLTNMEIHTAADLSDLSLPMKNITRLNLNVLDTQENMFFLDILKAVLQKAKQLQELLIKFPLDRLLKLEKRNYHEILDIVKSRGNNTKLTIKIMCYASVKDYRFHHAKDYRFHMDPKWLKILVSYKNIIGSNV